MDIPEHTYASYYWITFCNFKNEELQKLQDGWKDLPQIDGFSIEESSACLTFKPHKPKSENSSEISRCKTLNTQEMRRKVLLLQKIFNQRGFYFNIGRQTITKL